MIHSLPPGPLPNSTGLPVECYQESPACPLDLCPNPQDCLWNATRNPHPAPWISAQIHRVASGMLPGIHSLPPGALPNSTGRSLGCYQGSTACPLDLCSNPQGYLWSVTACPLDSPIIYRIVCGVLPGIHSLPPGSLPPPCHHTYKHPCHCHHLPLPLPLAMFTILKGGSQKAKNNGAAKMQIIAFPFRNSYESRSKAKPVTSVS